MTCANNCRGVNPNSVIVGGTAVLAASSVGKPARSFTNESTYQMCKLGSIILHVCTSGGIGFLGPALGVGAAGGAIAVISQMMSSCPRNRPCRVGFHKFELQNCAIFCQWGRDQ